MKPTPPDILVLDAEWPKRALLRAELSEAGYDVVAIDAWPMPGVYRRAGMKPRMVIVDLHGLPEPRAVLDELRFAMRPDRVLVITALGTPTVEEIRRIGYHAVARPTSVGDVIAAAADLLHANASPIARQK